MTVRKTKTKADLQRELDELRNQLESLKPKDVEVVSDEAKVDPSQRPKFLDTWGPAIVAIAGISTVLLFQRVKVDPKPEPGPGPKPASVERVVQTMIDEIANGHRETFIQAAELVRTGQIKTDKELFEMVRPALISLRAEKQRPFDEMFQMSLPRGDDGSFAGKEAEVESFLKRIAKAW